MQKGYGLRKGRTEPMIGYFRCSGAAGILIIARGAVREGKRTFYK